MPGAVFRSLYDLWRRRGDEYIGTLVNAWLAEGGEAWAVRAGASYLDVGAMEGYLAAMHSLAQLGYRDGRHRECAMSTAPTAPTTWAPGRDPAEGDRARGLVSQSRSGRRADGARSLPGRLSVMQVASFSRMPYPPTCSGKTVLDIGCNAGFYSLEMKRRGAARVVGIDSDPAYLAQARFAAEVRGAEIEFRELDVYHVESLDEKIRPGAVHGRALPFAASAAGAGSVVGARGGRHAGVPIADARQPRSAGARRRLSVFARPESFERAGLSGMYFVEQQYSHDPTNWWIPNRACAEAMLRSAGFEIVAHPEDEVYICEERRGIAESAWLKP